MSAMAMNRRADIRWDSGELSARIREEFEWDFRILTKLDGD